MTLRYGAVATRIGDGVLQIDTRLGGWDRVTAAYLVDGPEPVLVETGSRSSLPSLLAELEALGVGASDLAGVVVTHIHLDHAGGVGDVARLFPRATVYVHPAGARHLADPSRLVDSAARVYGDLLDGLYGRLEPTPAERVRALDDGAEVRVGPERVLTTVHAPGHAKHHLGLQDSASGILFTGDAAGVCLPDAGTLRPATPPPDFDPVQAHASLERFEERSPPALAFAHYGLVPDATTALDQAAEALRRWTAVAEEAWQEGRDIATAFEETFAGEVSGGDGDGGDACGGEGSAHREKLETLNGFHSNAAGFRRWFETRQPHPEG
ncbi:MAG: MBL fold metallo-hydrolase [Actinomycetota bacterium]|nr:MBL fold metallo-hydrolase [Actinomycetota bacterium]